MIKLSKEHKFISNKEGYFFFSFSKLFGTTTPYELSLSLEGIIIMKVGRGFTFLGIEVCDLIKIGWASGWWKKRRRRKGRIFGENESIMKWWWSLEIEGLKWNGEIRKWVVEIFDCIQRVSSILVPVIIGIVFSIKKSDVRISLLSIVVGE